jgi:type II secretory pathway pseudopilin PulG
VEQLVVLKQALRPLLQNNSIKTKFLKSNHGFSLLEILIAMVLIIGILGIALSNQSNNNESLRTQSNDIERALRFMSDEATLRNAVVRLHFMLNKAPQEYSVEYGPSDNFILPPDPELNDKVLTKEEEEKVNKTMKDVNMKFNKVQEFQDSNTEVSENVKILGVGNSNSQKMKSTGDFSIYAFPSGEKDDAIVILADEAGIISLEISPYNQKIERKSFPVEIVGSNRDINDVLAEKAKEIFETWLKDKK